jgi:hypothetical protein
MLSSRFLKCCLFSVSYSSSCCAGLPKKAGTASRVVPRVASGFSSGFARRGDRSLDSDTYCGEGAFTSLLCAGGDTSLQHYSFQFQNQCIRIVAHDSCTYASRRSYELAGVRVPELLRNFIHSVFVQMLPTPAAVSAPLQNWAGSLGQ